MEKKVLKFIEDNSIISLGDKILVGISGGPDSVALLHFLYSIKDEYKLTLIACHLNHALRGSDADEDEEFVKKLCDRLGVEFHSKRSDIRRLAEQRGESLEEAGRKERYKYYFYLKDRLGINKIALGHHKDDNIETILMHLFRGAGIRGLRGISARRPDGVIRPFLNITKSEIMDYCKSNSLSSKVDKTNFETDYYRNKLRLKVIPYLEDINPGFSDSLINLSKICQMYYDFVQNHVENSLKEVLEGDKIRVDEFTKLHEVIKTESLLKLIRENCDNDNVSYNHVKIVLDKLGDCDTTWSLDLPNKTKVVREYNYLALKEGDCQFGQFNYCYKLVPNKVYAFSKIDLTVKVEMISIEEYYNKKTSVNCGYFDYDKIRSAGRFLYLRNRKNGDKIEPIGMNGTKKIKDIFIDKKIPASRRWSIPLLCVDDTVIWVLGFHKSRKFAVDEQTKKIIRIIYSKHREVKIERRY